MADAPARYSRAAGAGSPVRSSIATAVPGSAQVSAAVRLLSGSPYGRPAGAGV